MPNATKIRMESNDNGALSNAASGDEDNNVYISMSNA